MLKQNPGPPTSISPAHHRQGNNNRIVRNRTDPEWFQARLQDLNDMQLKLQRSKSISAARQSTLGLRKQSDDQVRYAGTLTQKCSLPNEWATEQILIPTERIFHPLEEEASDEDDLVSKFKTRAQTDTDWVRKRYDEVRQMKDKLSQLRETSLNRDMSDNTTPTVKETRAAYMASIPSVSTDLFSMRDELDFIADRRLSANFKKYRIDAIRQFRLDKVPVT